MHKTKNEEDLWGKWVENMISNENLHEVARSAVLLL